MKYISLILAAVVIAALVVGCGSKGSKLYETKTTDSGLEIRELIVGNGATPDGDDTVFVQYTGWLTNGRLVESSAGGQPFEFDLWSGQVIDGWTEGIRGMSVGGKRRLVIPPQLGYGSQGNSELGVPGNATLIYELELVDMKRVDWIEAPSKSGLKYMNLNVATGPMPQPGQRCYVHYTGWLQDGTKFDENQEPTAPWSFILGAQGADGAIPGFDEGVASMTVPISPDEPTSKRKLIIPPNLAYGETGQGSIPPNATLIFEVELVDIENVQ